MAASPHISVAQAIEDIRAGKMVIVVDDEDRENEGDLTMAADLVTPEAINFMASHGRGLICLALTEERVEALRLPMMTHDNRSPHGTAFTVSIDARDGISTGISARERAHTIRVAVAPDASPTIWSRPGTSSRCARNAAACWSAPATPRAPSIWRAWPAARRPASSARSCAQDGEMARMADLETFAARSTGWASSRSRISSTTA